MTWSPSLVVVGIWLVIGFLLGLLELLLKYYWRDRRTRKHKTARKWLFILFVVSSVTALVLTMREKSSAEKQSKRLAQALDEAANERKIHTMAGRLETQHGMGQTFMFGGSTFVLMNSSSFFDGMGLSRVAPKIAEQNSIKVSNTFDGKLSVSARICGRDGLIAEIKDNEWKIAPPPKTWDRNYSTNALEPV